MHEQKKEIEKLNISIDLKKDSLKQFQEYVDNVAERFFELIDSDDKYKRSYLLYRVKRGDNLGSISRHYGISVKSVKEYNKMKSNIIYINQILFIPKG